MTKEQLDTLAKRGIQVSQASPEMLASLKTIGTTMTEEWRKKADAEQQEVLKTYEAKLSALGGQNSARCGWVGEHR